VKAPETAQGNPKAERNDRREPTSGGRAFTASTEKHHPQAPGTPAAAAHKTKTLVLTFSPPIVANHSVQDETAEGEKPPAIPADPDKASSGLLPSAVAGSWNALTRVAPPQPPPHPAPQIPEQGDRLVACSLLYRVEALYPPEAAQKHVEGTVKLRAVIGRDGRVMGLGVVSGPRLLVPAAMNAAREWRYIPALLNGEPVESETDIAIEFRLSREADQ